MIGTHVDSDAATLDPYLVRATGLALAGLLLFSACQSSDEPTLSTTQSNLVSSSTPNVYFPSTQVGQSSGPIAIQLDPLGVQSSGITNVIEAINEACPDFAVQASLPGYAYKTCEAQDPCYQQSGPRQEICPVPYFQPPYCGPGSETYPYVFTATFAPTAPVASSCPVTISYNDGSPRTYNITLYGTGTPPPNAADAIPANVNFGDVRVSNASSGATVTLRNTGGNAITVNSVSASAPFSLVSGNPGGYSLPPGGTHAYGVTCTPGGVGVVTGTLTIANSFNTITTQLRCNGVDSALDISPSPAAVATTRVSEPRETTIGLVNSGGAAMSIASVALAGTDMEIVSAPPAGTMLAANGGRADVVVRYMANAEGDVDGTLTVTYDGGQVRTSTVSARALATSMSVSPSGAVDLGPVCIGNSASKSFTVVANAAGPFQVQSIGMDGGDFIVEAANLPAVVEGAGANEYAFTVTTQPQTEGVASNTLTLSTDIPGAASTTIQVYATGLAAGISGTPSELYLGASAVGETTVGQKVVVTNCGDAPIDLANARIDGLEALEFAIVLSPDVLTVPPGGSLEWLVIGKPSSPGEKRAEFKVDHAEGTTVVALIGDGLGLTEDGTGTPSYYACSSGGTATGVGPLVIALGFVVRRRRRTRN